MPKKNTARVSRLRNKPVRRGRTYCSPACGANCTHAAFLEATRHAKNLAAQLGPGWKPVVRENMCWFYYAEHPMGVVVWPRAHGGFWVDIGGHGKRPDLAIPQFMGESSTPLAALEIALGQMAIVGAFEQRFREVTAPHATKRPRRS